MLLHTRSPKKEEDEEDGRWKTENGPHRRGADQRWEAYYTVRLDVSKHLMFVFCGGTGLATVLTYS